MTESKGFNIESYKNMMAKCQENLNKLAENYRATYTNNQEVSRLKEERQLLLDKISREYDVKIENARKNATGPAHVSEEVIRQIKAYQGFKETMKLLDLDIIGCDIDIPAEFQELAHEGDVDVHSATDEISSLAFENLQPYRTIEQSMKEMFKETRNKQMRPKEIIEYLREVKKIPQSEASIRTQLHNLKQRNAITQYANKTYAWNFTDEEREGLELIKLTSK